MTTVSGPGMHTFCVMFGRAGEGWRFAAISPRGEIGRTSLQLSDGDVAGITGDRATWPAWDTWDRTVWARTRKWSLVSVMGTSADIGNVAIS